MVCIIILQPFSLCDISFLLFKINGDFEISKKINYTDEVIKINDVKSNKYNAQKILLSHNNSVPVNNYENDINEIMKRYITYFDNDDNLGYRMLWLILLSYHIETLIKECNNDFTKLNINNIISYNKLFGVKQYKNKKIDYYKLRIEWVFNLFNEDKNVFLIIPNLLNYCNWFVIDDEKNEFFLNLCSEDSDVCELEED